MQLLALCSATCRAAKSQEAAKRKFETPICGFRPRLWHHSGTLRLNAAGAGKRGPTPKPQQQIERIAQLPKAKQRFVMEMLETVLTQASR